MSLREDALAMGFKVADADPLVTRGGSVVVEAMFTDRRMEEFRRWGCRITPSGPSNTLIEPATDESLDYAEDRLDEIKRLTKDYEEAVAEEQDAASRASMIRDQLSDLGVEVGE